jgi:uncharacterized protein YdhG (YjbR/CyaY superfamily)
MARCARDRQTEEEGFRMAERKAAKKPAAKSGGFTAEERAAMKERARELKADKSRAAGEADLLAKIAEMPKADRVLAERIHAIVQATAPELVPRTWYGMPAYAKDGKVLCFFKAAAKFDERYATFGFNDSANLDDGAMWPVVFGLKELTLADEKTIAKLVKRAVS